MKKVARQFVADKDILKYLKFIKNRNLQYSFWQDKNYFYISKQKELAEKAKILESDLSFSTEWKFKNLTERFVKEQKIINNFLRYRRYVTELGRLFRYPNCCINFYTNCWKEHIINPAKWNEEKMIGFDKRFENNVVSYNPEKINILGISKEIEETLKKGNKLENSKNYVKIFWDNQLIFRYKKKSPEECFVLCFY